MKTLILTFIVCTSFSICLCVDPDKYDVYFVSSKGVNYKNYPVLADYFDLKVTPYRDEQYQTLEGTFTYKTDFGNTTFIDVDTFYAKTLNDKFDRRLAYIIDPIGVCGFFMTVYRKYAQPMLEGKTNFPYIPEKGLCPIPKGKYYIEYARLSDISRRLPDLQDGYYRALVSFRQDFRNGNVGGVDIVFRVRRKTR